MKFIQFNYVDHEISPFKFIVIVTLMLLAGKLLGLADIDWIWVFSPVWGVLAIVVFVLILAGIEAIIVAIKDRKRR